MIRSKKRMTKVNGKENTDNSIKRGDNIGQRNKRSNMKRLNTVKDRKKRCRRLQKNSAKRDRRKNLYEIKYKKTLKRQSGQSLEMKRSYGKTVIKITTNEWVPVPRPRFLFASQSEISQQANNDEQKQAHRNIKQASLSIK